MGEGNSLNIRKSSCQWDVFGCEIFSQGKEVKASLFASRAGQNCFWSSGSSGSGGGGEKSSSCAWRRGRSTRGSGWMHSEKKQEELGRLEEEWCAHRHRAHKRSNRVTVGSSTQKRREGRGSRGEERQEWWAMLRDALQGASVQARVATARSPFPSVNSMASAKQSQKMLKDKAIRFVGGIIWTSLSP